VCAPFRSSLVRLLGIAEVRAGASESDQGGGQDDDREGNIEEEDRQEGRPAMPTRAWFLRARLPIRITASSTTARTAAFNPKKGPL
jgi:hypothetical protein